MGLYVKNAWYHYRKQIEGQVYYQALKIKKGQEKLLSARLEQVEEEITAQHFGLPYEKTQTIKLLDFIKRYLEIKKDKKSWDRDRQRLGVVGEVWGDIPLCEASRQHIERLERYLIDTRKIKPSTVNRYFEMLRHLFNLAIEEGYLKENPLKGYQFFVEDGERRALSRDEISRILDVALQIQRKPRGPVQAIIFDLILFGLNTGMRLGEIINLRKSYISGNQILYPIAETKSARRATRVQKLGAKVIVLNETAQQIINRQKSQDDFVLSIRRRNVHTVSRVIRLIRKITKIDDFHFHQLRHTVSTIIASQSSLAAAKVQLGHKSLSTTLKYTHPEIEEQRKTVANLENWLKETIPK